jgi:hypothetical protein
VKNKLAICLVLAAAASVLPTPASAQALLPPYEILTSVRSMGLQPISRPERRGARYVLFAVDRRGSQVKVAADALSGRILFVRPVAYGDERLYADRYFPEEVDPPRPPRGIYDRPPAPSYDRPPARPGEPSVIYAPRDNANAQPPARAPSVAKPPAPKVAAKPAAKPPTAAPAEAAAAEQPATTGTVPQQQPAEKPALAIPPVQSLE